MTSGCSLSRESQDVLKDEELMLLHYDPDWGLPALQTVRDFAPSYSSTINWAFHLEGHLRSQRMSRILSISEVHKVVEYSWRVVIVLCSKVGSQISQVSSCHKVVQVACVSLVKAVAYVLLLKHSVQLREVGY